MPNSNINKAIKKGTGELKDGNEIIEIVYEGYGPEGIAIIVTCHTDNKQRTVANIRHIFSKNGGNMGDKGCVSYMFSSKGILLFENVLNKEELEIAAINANCEDFLEKEKNIEIITSASKLHEVQEKLKKAGFNPNSSELTLVPSNHIKITDKDKANRIIKFMEKFEEDDDVYKVSSNFEIKI